MKLFARKPSEPVKRKVNLADPERLAALRRLKIMDTPPEESLDRLTRIAAKVVGAPVALLTLVDNHRQYFKSAYGLPESLQKTRQTPVSLSFCQHVVMDQAPMVVADARLDPRLKDNPAIEKIGVIAYAGMPVFAPNGEPLGSFCVMDTKVRNWEPDQLAVLKDLAASVMAELEAKELANALVEQEQARIGISTEIADDVSGSLRSLIKDLNNVLESKTVGPAILQAIQTAQKVGVRLSDIEDVACLDEESISPTQRRHNLSDIVNAALKDTAKLAQELDIDIDQNIPDHLPMVLVSAPMIQRVFRILVRQSLRLTTRGTIRIWAAAEGHSVACYVSTPCTNTPSSETSISADMQKSVGMAFCKRVIEDHGGTLEYVKADNGTDAIRFTITAIPRTIAN